eukprot:8774109-Pyramimonas_sp.AAC.1
MKEKAAIQEHAKEDDCAQLTLPLRVSAEEMEELISGNGWQRQSHGSSVGMLRALLEGHQLLASDPKCGGHVKQGNVGVHSFPYVSDTPFCPQDIHDGGGDVC